MFKGEKEFSVEAEKEIETKVILEFMRHAQQESGDMEDKDKRLTEEGRTQAEAKGEKMDPQAGVSLGWASPRDRAQETEYRVMTVNEDINSEATLEEIEKEIEEKLRAETGGLKVKKLRVSEKLDYNDDGELGKKLWAADEKGEFYKWLLEESDKDALEYPGDKGITYTRAAGNIAELVGRYLKVGETFNRIASKTEKYEEFGNQLERYFGTHQGIVELFMAKVIEKKEGIEKRNEYISSIGEGFAHTEGIRIEIINKGKDQKINLQYRFGEESKAMEVDKELIAEIIGEKKLLESKVAE